MLSIGVLGSASQGASYYERDGYYAKDDPEHKAASAWAGAGAAALGLDGEVDADVFRTVLEGKVPDGSGTQLGRRGKEGSIEHRPGRDLTFSAPKSVSLAALVGGDERIVDAHDRAVAATLAWVEKNAGETRMQDPATGRMVRAGSQKIVAATFRHDTSRNLDPQLHTHAVLANLVQGEDGKWRSMANEGLYERQKLIGMLYRSELARGLSRLGYGVEKTHADGRFEIAGVARQVVEAFSTRRAEIEAAMAERGLGDSADSPRLAERAALMTRAAKRDIDREELRGVWERQARRARVRREGAGGRGGVDGCRSDEGGRGDGSGLWQGASNDRGGRARSAWRGGARDGSRGPGARGSEPGGGRRCLGDGASVGARGGVRPRRSARRRARPRAGRGDDRRGRTRGGGTGECRHAARRAPSRRGGLVRDGEDRGRGARDGGADAGRRRPGPLPDAGLGRPGTSEQGSAHGRAEGGGEAHPVCEGPGGRRSGLRRNRQDHHARPGAGARGRRRAGAWRASRPRRPR